MRWLGGIDIGGTKCAVVLGRETETGVEVVGKRKFSTLSSPHQCIEAFIRDLLSVMEEHAVQQLDAIGISCGGPLDSNEGMILSPPNLPGWDRIDIVSPLQRQFQVPVALQNDANACALAEWKWGAGKGCRNMVFLTFGTGMGAGLILNGQLYSGTNDNAGEVGHIRMEKQGPVGYGKVGSFEGFCSGGGIARLAKGMIEEHIAAGGKTLLCHGKTEAADMDHITAQSVAEAAHQGDELALNVYRTTARQLGRGLAIIIDLLNPERIVIGSIYGRQQQLLEADMLRELEREALPGALSVCRIVPAGLQESVGDLASLSVALHALERGAAGGH